MSTCFGIFVRFKIGINAWRFYVYVYKCGVYSMSTAAAAAFAMEKLRATLLDSNNRDKIFHACFVSHDFSIRCSLCCVMV